MTTVRAAPLRQDVCPGVVPTPVHAPRLAHAISAYPVPQIHHQDLRDSTADAEDAEDAEDGNPAPGAPGSLLGSSLGVPLVQLQYLQPGAWRHVL